jgi:hypothetical protein
MRSSLPTKNLAGVWRTLASEPSTVGWYFGQDIQGVSPPRDSFKAACLSGPSPGRGYGSEVAVSKLSGKSLSISGLTPEIYDSLGSGPTCCVLGTPGLHTDLACI